MPTPTQSNRYAPVDPEAIERERARRAWSVETLALKSGVSVNTVKRIMKGKEPFWATLGAIARALTVPVEALTKISGVSLSPKDTFELHIRTVGVVNNSDELARLMSALPQIIVGLRASGITIISQESSLSLPTDKDRSERILLSVEGVARGRIDFTGVIISGSARLALPFWYFYAVRRSELAAMLQAIANQTFNPTAFDPRYGEELASGNESQVPDAIIEVTNSLTPFPGLP
jgi:transcriptional regulator with XRE-family HTH domain